MTHALVPLCILTMVSVMEGIDSNLPKAALTLGAPRGSAFWTVYFPLSVPGVAAAGLMVFITALAFFITPTFLGGRRDTMLTQLIIEQVQELLNWGFAGALSLLLLIATLIVFLIYDRMVGLSTLAGSARLATGREKGPVGQWLSWFGQRVLMLLGRLTDMMLAMIAAVMPRRREATAGTPRGYVLGTIVVLTLLYLVLPALIMVPISFTSASVIDWPPKGFSLNWYETFWNSRQWISALVRSFTVALVGHARDADRHAGRLRAGARHLAGQDGGARLPALAADHSAHDHRCRAVLFLCADRPRRLRRWALFSDTPSWPFPMSSSPPWRC